MTTTYKTYKWFNPRPCTITEGTAMYRDLASKHHPDHGGSVSDMQEINAEWDELKPTLPRFCSEQAKQGRQQYQQARPPPQPRRALMGNNTTRSPATIQSARTHRHTMAAAPPGERHKTNGSRCTSPQNRLHPPPVVPAQFPGGLSSQKQAPPHYQKSQKGDHNHVLPYQRDHRPRRS